MNGSLPEWAQHPERRYVTDAEDALSETERLADRLYEISRRDPDDYNAPHSKAALIRFNLAVAAALRDFE